jgi:valyl-tRNA synthetase
MTMPEKPSLDGLEAKWGEWWEAAGTYRFDRTKARDQVYSIDTPPPTVSGSLHVGHVMSYTHTDVIARYKRMAGLEVFYPIGWDDNGLATERRVQNYFGVRCDPSVPFDPAFDASGLERPDDAEALPISRPNFIDLCHRLTAEDERAFERLIRTLALSVDWTTIYTTIGEGSRRASQRAFLHLLERGLTYRAEAPTMWDVDYQTAVAQAEIEDREISGAYHRIRFERDGGGEFQIETSRPELIPACVALVVNPDDARYAEAVGATALTPLFRVPVPVLAHPLAEPDKGTGIAMICTFGDITDVTWWRELSLPTRVVMGRDGTILESRWGEPGWESRDAAGATAAHGELAGLTAKRARTRIVEMLRESADLLEEPKQVRHVVKFYERGERPLEVISSRQWYVKQLDIRDRLLERGRELAWHPPHMRSRFESWVEGLNSNWCISRQRFFGVPFPVWYRLDSDGNPDHEGPIVPDESRLPIDPSDDVPQGFEAAQRGQPGGFVGDPDVMDTWATSSISPQIAARWGDDDDLFGRVFPMDLRPQAHDIIRTWLYYTVLKSHLEHDSLPWTNVAISGWVLDPDRKKMSKSKGNALTPLPVLEQHGADAVRYWASSARLGIDTAFDEKQMKVGRRLAIKILNASRFALSMDAEPGPIIEPLDLSMLSELAVVIAASTDAFQDYDHARALDRTESFFWGFTDDYVELVKQRAYGSQGAEAAGSAVAALRLALDVQLRLFAPFLPFVTEEVWSWWLEGSIHRADWPDPGDLAQPGQQADPGIYEVAATVLGAIRKEKALQRVSLKTPCAVVRVEDTADRLEMLAAAFADVREAGGIQELETSALADGTEPSVQTTLAPSPAQG